MAFVIPTVCVWIYLVHLSWIHFPLLAKAEQLTETNVEGHLLAELLSKYDVLVRPSLHSADNVTVGQYFYPQKIVDVDETRLFITIGVVLEYEWYDHRLSWEASHYDGMVELNIPGDKVWQPDIVLVNSVDHDLRSSIAPVVKVANNGHVIAYVSQLAKIPCEHDITKFPYDKQLCYAMYGSWTYGADKLSLLDHTVHISTSAPYFKEHSQWDVESTRIYQHVISYGEPRHENEYSLLLRRRSPGHHMVLHVLPAVLLTLLVPLMFVLPTANSHRVGLGSGVLVTVILLLVLLHNHMPAAITGSLIARFYMGLFCLEVVAIIVCSITTRLTNATPWTKAAPHWLVYIMGRIGHVLCVGQAPSPYASLTNQEQEMDAMSFTNGTTCPDKDKVIPMGSKLTDILARQWHYIATVFDRIAFIVFLVSIIILNLTILPKIH